MNRFNAGLRWAWSILVVSIFALALGGCDGDDGAAGAAGAAGPPGADGPPGPPGPVPDLVAAAIESADVESCATCHDGVGTGRHQAIYNQYKDASTFVLAIDNVVSAPGAAGGFDLTLDFNIMHNGMPYIDAVGLAPSVDSMSFYVVEYDSVADEFLQPGFSPFPSLDASLAASNGDGTYTLMQNVEYDPVNFESGAIIGQLGDGKFDFPDNPGNSSNHLAMYNDLSSASFTFGNINTWTSAANVSGCAKCHGAPYRKHGNVEASIAGVPDFARCKTCHFDNRTGGHTAWQYMVDEPLNWANGVAETADYSYAANIMNVTHMSHAMEFPYPMSMSNCASCHEGKLDRVIADATFTAETCVSCHALQGIDTWPKTFDANGDEILGGRSGTSSVPEQYAQVKRAPPFEYLWMHNTSQNYVALHQQVLASGDPCTVCHTANGIAPAFSAYHTGYDTSISDMDGVSYATQYTVQIDQVTWDALASTLKIDFSANDAAIVPEVLVSFYGWDSKHFIIPSHARDADRNRFEYEPDDTNPLFSDFAETTPGVWTVTANLAAFLPVETDDILTLISNDVIKNAEITITPTLTLAGEAVVLKAVDRTVSLQDGLEVPDYFKAGNATVAISKCNVCHDALASSFHDGSGRAGDGIEVCRNCHNPTFPGSHIEMASRSIDSYVHAIHSFQPFDLDEVAEENDPVKNARTAQHMLHTFPNFTITNCEACHIAGTYNVPDQSKSMPGVLSKSWAIADRNIGSVPEAVTGPASRACGGCHRADLINPDLAGELASFNAHTDAFGTLEDNDDDDLILFGIIDKIMSMFE